jgi:hypothetical protein
MVKTPKLDSFEKHLLTDKTGFSMHRNTKNGFVVVQLDFTADPMKRDPEWIAKNKSQMPPKQWAVEMERSWETYSGRAIYEKAFYKHLHITPTPILYNPLFPIFRGFDFGGSQSAIICQIINDRLNVLDELPNKGLNTRAFAPEVIAFCNSKYGTDVHYIDIIDPSAMWEGKTAEGKACADVMREYDMLPIAASTNDPQKRIDAVIELLMRLCSDGKPALQISPNCQMLIRGFEGGYHYPEKMTQAKRMDRPVKNLFSHIHDALQYVALRMKSHSTDRSEEIDYESAATRYKFSNN